MAQTALFPLWKFMTGKMRAKGKVYMYTCSVCVGVCMYTRTHTYKRNSKDGNTYTHSHARTHTGPAGAKQSGRCDRRSAISADEDLLFKDF